MVARIYNLSLSGIDLTTTDPLFNILSQECQSSGSQTFSGDGITIAFTFAHGLPSAPRHIEISPTSADATIAWRWSTNATEITITFASAPPSGTDNVTFSWRAWVF